MVVNRIGDVGLALAMFTIFYIFGSLEFATIFGLTPYVSEQTIIFAGFEFNILSLIGSLILVGAIGKSAQLGLHT